MSTQFSNLDDLRKCPVCAELIKTKAVFCKYCHSSIPLEQQSKSYTISQSMTNFQQILYRCRPWIIVGSIAITVLVIAISYFSPYWTIYCFFDAVLNRDSTVLNDLIDFPSLKENLKTQLVSTSVEQLVNNSGGTDDSWAAIGSFLGMSIANNAIDNLFTPANFDGLIFGTMPKDLNVTPTQVFFNILSKSDTFYETFNSFLLRQKTTPDNDAVTISFNLERAGFFAWKLDNIILSFPKEKQLVNNDSSSVPQVTPADSASPQQAFNSDTTVPKNTSADPNNLINQMIASTSDSDNASFDQSISNLEALPKPSPGNVQEAERLNKIGLQDLKTTQYSDAISMFKSASLADPSDPKFLSNLGFAEMSAGDLSSAEKDLYASLAISPSRSVAWGDLGEVFAKEGKQDQAVSCLLIGYKVSAGNTLGYLKSLQSDPDPAIQSAGSEALNKIQAGQTP